MIVALCLFRSQFSYLLINTCEVRYINNDCRFVFVSLPIFLFTK